MGRLPRIDPPGTWHHVMNRGARHQAIFADDADRAHFLELLGVTSARYSLEIHAYALMGNHYHVLLRSLRGRLSEGMRHLQQSWTQTVNRRHGWDGPLFRARFRNQIVEDERYLRTVLAYIHLNPVRAGLATRASTASWTSHRAYLGRRGGPAWLHCDELLRSFGTPAQLEAEVDALADLPDDLGEELVDGLDATGPLVGDRLQTPPDERSQESPEPVLERIEAITRCSRNEFRQGGRGARVHPAQRFAIWALRSATNATQPEVAMLLGVSVRQVQSVEFRLRRKHPPPIDSWVRAWLSGEESGSA